MKIQQGPKDSKKLKKEKEKQNGKFKSEKFVVERTPLVVGDVYSNCPVRSL